MKPVRSPEPMHRRDFLQRGVLFGLTLCGGAGGCATKPMRQEIHQLEGSLTVDGRPAGPDTLIRPGQTVATSGQGRLTLVMGEDAFLLGPSTRVAFQPADSRQPMTSTGFTLQAGRILSVFGPGPRGIKTPTATIGIRGTGLFLQAEPERDYLCLCYGRIEIRMHAKPEQVIPLESRYHASRYLSGASAPSKAPMHNHTDEELFLLESLVNRRPLLDDGATGY
ncbi:MAG: hypothetical protein HQL96_00475 [Magnetococcales bacterium]|nr:hypothetical protein [Magnetococcales bacterium]